MKRISISLAVAALLFSAIPVWAAQWDRELTLATTTGQRTVTLRTFWGEALERGTPFLPIRVGPTGPVALPPGTFNPSGTVTDTVPIGDSYACYAIMLLHGLPGQLSNVECFAPGTATGLAPPTVTMFSCSQLTDSCTSGAPRISVSWTAPLGEFTGYTVVTFSDGGTHASSMPRGQTSTGSQAFTTPTCYVVFVMNGIIPVGQSDLMCAFPMS